MYIHTHVYPDIHTYTQIYIYMYTYNLYYTQICIYVYSRSLSLVSLSLSPFSLSLSLALSLSFCLSISLFSLSLAVSLQVFVTWYLYVSRRRARAFSSSQTFSVFLSLSFFLSCSLALSFSFCCIHICTYQSWETCTQPHLSGFTLGNSLASISATLSLRCLIPAVDTTVNLPPSRESVFSEYSPAPLGTPTQKRLSHAPARARANTRYTSSCIVAQQSGWACQEKGRSRRTGCPCTARHLVVKQGARSD